MKDAWTGIEKDSLVVFSKTLGRVVAVGKEYSAVAFSSGAEHAMMTRNLRHLPRGSILVDDKGNKWKVSDDKFGEDGKIYVGMYRRTIEELKGFAPMPIEKPKAEVKVDSVTNILEYRAQPGEEIREAARKAVELAATAMRTGVLVFRDVKVVVYEDDTINDVIDRWLALAGQTLAKEQDVKEGHEFKSDQYVVNCTPGPDYGMLGIVRYDFTGDLLNNQAAFKWSDWSRPFRPATDVRALEVGMRLKRRWFGRKTFKCVHLYGPADPRFEPGVFNGHSFEDFDETDIDKFKDFRVILEDRDMNDTQFSGSDILRALATYAARLPFRPIGWALRRKKALAYFVVGYSLAYYFAPVAPHAALWSAYTTARDAVEWCGEQVGAVASDAYDEAAGRFVLDRDAE